VVVLFKGDVSRVLEVRDVLPGSGGGSTKSAFITFEADADSMANWWTEEARAQGEHGWVIRHAPNGTPVPTRAESYQARIVRLGSELHEAIASENFELAHGLNVELKILKERAPIDFSQYIDLLLKIEYI